MNGTPHWPVDFPDAHERHWEDGEMLYHHEKKRWANADHLYGLSAECGLKAVMVRLGVPTDAQGSPEKRYKLHINELWEKFLTFAHGRGAARYTVLLTSTNPFSNWAIEQRYVHQNNFPEPFIKPHRGGANEVCLMVREARKDGLIV